MYVQLENIVKTYDQSVAVDDLTLAIEQGEFLVLLGPSGCGKTTTMRSLVGLEEPTSGRISVGGQVLFDRTKGINVPANQRGMGMVFQSYAIWPHMTVFQNVSYPLEMQRLSRAETRRRVEEMLELVGLEGLGPRGASQLSGGQMQRVALARSLVMRPKVLLLDEPLSNLDAKLRDKLRFELRAIQQELGTTSVYVTHDQAEALALADRIAVMRAGKIVQLEAPTELYRRPANTFVADFLGASNLLRGFVRRENGEAPHVRLGDSPHCLPIAADDTTPADGSATHLSIRPEVVDLLDASAEIRPGRLPAVVKVASFLGTHVRYHVQLIDGPDMYVMSHDTERLLKAGSPAVVSVPPSSIQVLAE